MKPFDPRGPKALSINKPEERWPVVSSMPPQPRCGSALFGGLGLSRWGQPVVQQQEEREKNRVFTTLLDALFPVL